MKVDNDDVKMVWKFLKKVSPAIFILLGYPDIGIITALMQILLNLGE